MRGLTDRELDVLRGVALGLSNRQIAFALGLRPQVVKNYLKRVYDKLLPIRNKGGMRHRLAAVRVALWWEILDENDIMQAGPVDRLGIRLYPI